MLIMETQVSKLTMGLQCFFPSQHVVWTEQKDCSWSNPLTITQSLLAIIDKNQLPKHYGGEADGFCLSCSRCMFDR
jgi:hypothetical protein